MSLRIATNVEAVSSQRSIRVSADRLATSMRRLSSGLRINSAADDAAGLGISERLRAQIRGLEQANRNVQDGISLVQTAEAALSEVHSILHRARDLAVMWNQKLGANDFSYFDPIRAEFDELKAEVQRIEETTHFGTIELFTDATRTITLQVGANDGDTLMVSLTDLFGTNLELVNGASFEPLPWLDADIPGLDASIDAVAQARARFGSYANRLEHAQAMNQVVQENLMDAESRIRETDMAAEMTALTRQQIVQRSATSALLHANRSSQRVLSLLP